MWARGRASAGLAAPTIVRTGAAGGARPSKRRRGERARPRWTTLWGGGEGQDTCGSQLAFYTSIIKASTSLWRLARRPPSSQPQHGTRWALCGLRASADDSLLLIIHTCTSYANLQTLIAHLSANALAALSAMRSPFCAPPNLPKFRHFFGDRNTAPPHVANDTRHWQNIIEH